MKELFTKTCVHDIERRQRPTVVIRSAFDSNGSAVTEIVVIEEQINPLAPLTYDDFILSRMIANGVKYKPLNISKDLRIGSDTQIKSFNERIEKMSNELVVTE